MDYQQPERTSETWMDYNGQSESLVGRTGFRHCHAFITLDEWMHLVSESGYWTLLRTGSPYPWLDYSLHPRTMGWSAAQQLIDEARKEDEGRLAMACFLYFIYVIIAGNRLRAFYPYLALRNSYFLGWAGKLFNELPSWITALTQLFGLRQMWFIDPDGSICPGPR